ncbi:M67 family metallopeptidase [Novosphingobium flavum]|uniref:M67 family metallopeptidase n=1 Tax=Novosphingobium flavum TaxID=1778672 RepID=A0A7X1KN47_9SPHN|nr:M67 family metallopeptidase [Novosphingobium flavum]MBC2667272.1 M67 family metallopeptidase [Novosphingobium flavum]
MLVFTPVAHAAMLAAARAAHPREACGLLLGGGGRVDAATLARNVHPEPARHFEIDPLALIAAHKAARAGGPQVLGYWHSHPNGRDEPSEEDQAMASGDGRVWAIVAGGDVTLWRDDAAGFSRLPYIIGEG